MSAAGMAVGADGLPPLHVPLRFFATAAICGLLAGLLWAAEGDVAFATRWAPGLLAGTHLLVLGFFTMVMFGALFQVVPVLGGGPLPRAIAVANAVHPCLFGGVLCLAYGLWRSRPGYLAAALGLLAAAFAVFVPAVAWCLWRARAAALRPVRLAVLAFAGTVVLGMLMAGALGWPRAGLPFRAWTNVHAAWGGLGWGLLLVIGVSHQVVPMFHVTPPFGRWTTRLCAPLVLLGLVSLVPGGAVAIAGTVAIAAGGLWHVGATWRLLAARRRRRRDATVLGWQCGLAGVAAALLLVLADAVLPASLRPGERVREFEFVVAVLFGLGGIGTIVMGMLTKIVPFLAFLQLQRRCLLAPAAVAALPTMDQIVSGRAAMAQVLMHLVAAAGVLTAASLPAFGRIAGWLLVADFGACFVVVAAAAVRYRCATAAIDRVMTAGSGNRAPR